MTYIAGTQKPHLNEMILLNTQKRRLKEIATISNLNISAYL